MSEILGVIGGVWRRLFHWGMVAHQIRARNRLRAPQTAPVSLPLRETPLVHELAEQTPISTALLPDEVVVHGLEALSHVFDARDEDVACVVDDLNMVDRRVLRRERMARRLA
jgi:hypothetical protein